MDFFNKLTQKAKETYEGASKKTGELAKEAKIRMKMNENKSTINSLYQEIGKKVYEKHIVSQNIDIKTELEEECTKIDVLSEENDSFLKQLRELKDKKQCPNCFKEIDLEAKFCNYCGAKQEEIEAKEPEVITNAQTADEDTKFVSDSYIEVEKNETADTNEQQEQDKDNNNDNDTNNDETQNNSSNE